MNYLIERSFRNNEDDEYASYTDIQYLLRLESEDSDEVELGKAIKETTDWISKMDGCSIKGSKEVLELYNSIDNEKMDFILPLSEVEYNGFHNNNEIILELDGYRATGIYNFTGSFLESLFHMKRFGNFCFTHGERELLDENIQKLMTTQKEEVRLFRFLMDGDALFLRGLTTIRYKRYDNNIAIYLALNSLHRYSEENGVHIYVEKADITDSCLDITFVQEENFRIDKDTFVKVGVRLTNNEISVGKLSMQFIYTIYDGKNHQFRAIGDTVIGIIHTYQIPTIEEKIKNFRNLSKYTNETIQYINAIKNRNRLDRDQLSLIFHRLSRTKDNKLTKKSRDTIDALYREEVIGNTYSLIELFGRIDSLITTIDEKLFLQVVFNELITTSL
jgi:hypothetical protein